AFGTSSVILSNSQIFAVGGARTLTNNVTLNNALEVFLGTNSIQFNQLSNTGGSSTLQNNIAGGSLTFAATLALQDTTANRTLTITGAAPTTLNAPIVKGAPGPASRTLNASGGTLTPGTPAGSSTYTGAFTITAGTVRLNNSEQIPDGATVANATTINNG